MYVHSHTGVYIPIQARAFLGVYHATCTGRNRGCLPRALTVQGCRERVKLLFLPRALKGFPVVVGYTQVSSASTVCSNAVCEKAYWELGWDGSELHHCLGREGSRLVRFGHWDHGLKVNRVSFSSGCFNCSMGYVWFNTHLTDPLSILEQRLEPIYAHFSRKQYCVEN